jgi:hypothetical protein
MTPSERLCTGWQRERLMPQHVAMSWPQVPEAQRRRLILLLRQLVSRPLGAVTGREESASDRYHPAQLPRHRKMQGHHRDRCAVVSVRQSTVQHMLRPQASTRLQDGLVDRTLTCGWAQPPVLVMDAD